MGWDRWVDANGKWQRMGGGKRIGEKSQRQRKGEGDEIGRGVIL